MQQSGSGTPIHLFSYPGLRSIVGTYSVVHPLFRHNPLFSSLPAAENPTISFSVAARTSRSISPGIKNRCALLGVISPRKLG